MKNKDSNKAFSHPTLMGGFCVFTKNLIYPLLQIATVEKGLPL